MSMIDLYIRLLIVAVISSTLAWIVIKYLLSKYHYNLNVGTLDLLVCVIVASSVFGFVGIVLVDRTQYAELALFYWGIPIALGSVFGVIAFRQIMPHDKE